MLEFIKSEKRSVWSALDECKDCKGFKESIPMFRNLLNDENYYMSKHKINGELRNCLMKNNIIGLVNNSPVWNRKIVKKYFEDLLEKGEL